MILAFPVPVIFQTPLLNLLVMPSAFLPEAQIVKSLSFSLMLTSVGFLFHISPEMADLKPCASRVPLFVAFITIVPLMNVMFRVLRAKAVVEPNVIAAPRLAVALMAVFPVKVRLPARYRAAPEAETSVAVLVLVALIRVFLAVILVLYSQTLPP